MYSLCPPDEKENAMTAVKILSWLIWGIGTLRPDHITIHITITPKWLIFPLEGIKTYTKRYSAQIYQQVEHTRFSRQHTAPPATKSNQPIYLINE